MQINTVVVANDRFTRDCRGEKYIATIHFGRNCSFTDYGQTPASAIRNAWKKAGPSLNLGFAHYNKGEGANELISERSWR